MSRNLNDLGHLFFILFLAPASAKSSALNNVIRPVQIPTTTHCFLCMVNVFNMYLNSRFGCCVYTHNLHSEENEMAMVMGPDSRQVPFLS